MVCGEPKFFSCGNGTMPADFCCGPGTYCIPLARNTALLCCPQGQSCSLIQPIVCDLYLQNSTAHPDTPLRTANLSGTLPTCGSLCCPFGYTCQDSKICVLDTGKSNFALGATSTPRRLSIASMLSSKNGAQQNADPTSLPDYYATSLSKSSTSSSQDSFTSWGAISSDSAPAVDNSKSPIVLGLTLTLGLLLSLLIIWLLFMRGRRRRRFRITQQARERLERRVAASESMRLQIIEAEFPVPPKVWRPSPESRRPYPESRKSNPMAAGLRAKSKVWESHMGAEIFELPATPVYVRRSRGQVWPSQNHKAHLGGNM